MALPKAFVRRRLHSLTGLFLSLYLIEHLLVNSQSALFLGDYGAGFVRAVNGIHDLPYLKAIEILLLLIPFLYHGALGIIYLFEASPNSFSVSPTLPTLPEYPRNHAYTWQRITAFILVFGIIAHVIHMRFFHYPEEVRHETATSYHLEVSKSPEMVQLAEAWKVPFAEKGDKLLLTHSDFGTAELFVVRNAFLSPTLMVLYLLFVLSSVFHGFNGLWTFLITWGFTLSERGQRLSRRFSSFVMVLIAIFGVMAIFGGL